MNNSVFILFYIKRAKVNASGNCVIYARVTINTKRFEFSTGKSINSDNWSAEGSKAKGTGKEARLINDHLDLLKSKIIEAEKKLLKTDVEITAETMRNELLGIDARKRMLIPIFKDHNAKIKELVGKEFAPGTLERYETSLKHTVEFLQWKYNISDIDIAKIDHAFITDYEFFLRSVRNCSNNTAVKYIKNFNKIVRICLANHWIDRNPFANYKAKVKEVERVYLTEEELQEIINKDLEIERLSIVRDIFIFSCFTGMAYIDVKNLTRSHISTGIDGVSGFSRIGRRQNPLQKFRFCLFRK